MPKKEAPAPYEFKVTIQPPHPLTKFGFSKIEVRDLLISALLVSCVGLSMLGPGLLLSPPGIVAVLVLVFTGSFLLHEMAHKSVAQRYGLWAEFRLTLFGALLTLISIVSPFLKIISPGAVMIAGASDKDSIGKTAISGPLINLVICMGSFVLTFLVPRSNLFFEVVLFAAAFNAFIAALNLLPFGMFDGWKVFQYSKFMWALIFVSAVALTVGIFTLYSDYIRFF